VPLALAGIMDTGVVAMADLDSYVTGGHAWRSNASKTVNIADTLGNNESVYVQYTLANDATVRRVDNTSGVNTTVSATAQATTIKKLRACQDIQFQPDSCDSYKS